MHTLICKTRLIMSTFRKRHWPALLFAAMVGALYVAPHILFPLSSDADYQGIPMLQTSNEDYYLTRIREIIDGHYATGSFVFYEYKEKPPLTPPTIEFLYALPTLLFDIPYTTTAIASRFVLPAALFLLVYFLLARLASSRFSPRDPPRDEREDALVQWSAVAGALVVTLGYDFVDYRGMIHLLMTGEPTTSSLLFWSRLVHPISGGLLLFSFLLALFAIAERTSRRTAAILTASASLAVMFASYFFSWGLALSILAAALCVFFLKKEYGIVKNLLICGAGALALSAPYWALVFRMTQDPLYEESVARAGLFYTHVPIFNKFMLAVLVMYVLLVILAPALQARRASYSWKSAVLKTITAQTAWQLFTLALILGSLLAYVQQVVTGMTIWPYHFAQYTIPLGIVSLFALFHHKVRPLAPRLWSVFLACLIGASLVYGVFIQTHVYRGSFADNVALEQAAPLFSFLAREGEPCVVLVNAPPESGRNWNYLVTAFTPCDVYAESGVSLLIPYERVLHNYLVILRLRGLTSATLDGYLKDNPDEPRGYLFTSWEGLYKFVDDDPVQAERFRTLPDDFRAFLKKDFRAELRQYRLDYIFSFGPLLPSVLAELPGTELVKTFDALHLYQFR
ncbi:MAG: hypothetical protein AAB699_02450 [Patescibacteria group bacterium]